MIELLIRIPFFWEACVRFLSKPVLWLSEQMKTLGNRIADQAGAQRVKLGLYIFLAVEVIVFVIYALQTSLGDIAKNLIGCSPYGGFLDMYETLFLGSNRGMHLWLTSGFLWLLDSFVSCLVKRSGQPGFMKVIFSVALALFFSAVVSPIYLFFAGLVKSLLGNLTVLSFLPLIIIMIPVVFAFISGLWMSIANCYDLAFVVIAVFGIWAIFPKMWTDDTVALIAIALLIIIFSIVKHFLSKTKDVYNSLSIFHYLIREKAEDSTLCAILFFIGSVYSMMFFISLTGILFGSAETVEMMRSWFKPV